MPRIDISIESEVGFSQFTEETLDKISELLADLMNQGDIKCYQISHTHVSPKTFSPQPERIIR